MSFGLVIATIFFSAAYGVENAASKQIEPTRIDRIPPGTVVFDPSTRGLSDLILFIKGKLEAGDTDVVNDTTRFYGDLFNLVYMANVKKTDNGFKLDTVAVGFSSKVEGRDIVVNSETARDLGLSLNLIGRSVLSGNERALQDINVMAKNDQCVVIDAPAIVRFNGRNERMVVRFFIWTSAADGQLGTTAWLLARSGNGFTLAENTFNFLPPEMVEERVLHVDGSQFTLGIPSATAFAMVSIPQGRSFKFTARLRRVAALETFTPQTFNELILSAAEAMGQGG
ncbi:MAG TPA: pyruvate kinase [Planctomycetaceae bacterium]|nr:pyruvate kinase [Planctomycetaceae bacterium]